MLTVTVNNNSPIQDFVHVDGQTQPTFEMTPGFKPFTVRLLSLILLGLVVMRGKMSVFLQLMCLQSSIGRHQHPHIWLSGIVQNGYHR